MRERPYCFLFFPLHGQTTTQVFRSLFTQSHFSGHICTTQAWIYAVLSHLPLKKGYAEVLSSFSNRQPFLLALAVLLESISARQSFLIPFPLEL
jgi:hypothetical protein